MDNLLVKVQDLEIKIENEDYQFLVRLEALSVKNSLAPQFIDR